MLRTIASDIWVVEQPRSLFGLKLGARTTVVRLQDGGLWVHSPLPMNEAIRKAIRELGPVRFIVAPSLYHHLFVGEWVDHFPEARFLGAPGLSEKRKDVRFHGALTDAAETGYQGDLEQHLVRGMPKLNEVVFFHPKSRTLIVTDWVFHFPSSDSFWTRTYLQMNRAYGRVAPTFLIKALTQDKKACRESLKRILSWDFDRLIMSHGQVLHAGGKTALRDGFRWLLP